jgi:hypothetical protein
MPVVLNTEGALRYTYLHEEACQALQGLIEEATVLPGNLWGQHL